jgi:hypothetical protein
MPGRSSRDTCLHALRGAVPAGDRRAGGFSANVLGLPPTATSARLAYRSDAQSTSVPITVSAGHNNTGDNVTL